MEKHELLTLAASNIAGGMASEMLSMVRGSPAQQGKIEQIAELSVKIAVLISDEADKHG
jgi:hypothetical protein